jgi:methyl-accepting chemotaxis protein
MIGNGWNIVQRLTTIFALGPIALIFVGTIAYLNTRDIVTTGEAFEHSAAVQFTIDDITARITEASAAEREYVITGQNSYLQAYDAATLSVRRTVDDLAKLTVDDPQEQANVFAFRPLVERWLAQLSAIMAVRHAHGFAAAIAVTNASWAKNIMDQIRPILRASRQYEASIRELRAAAAKVALTRTRLAIIAGTLVTIGLLLIIGYAAIRSIRTPVEEVVAELTSATAEILAGTTQQAGGVQEQAAAVAQTTSTVEEIAQTAEQASQRARAVAGSSQRATESSLAGRRAVAGATSAMADVKVRTEAAAQSILSLAEQAQAIGEITAFVNDVADQTNILAFNASIEASRAGEQGKGFNVVADEIKALAAQSKKATHQIRQILGDIEKATTTAVFATEAGNKAVDRAMQTVNEADEVIRSLSDTILEAAQSSLQITASTGQQAIGISQIQQAMKNISRATSQNLEATLQAEKSARRLGALGTRLRVLVRGESKFAQGREKRAHLRGESDEYIATVV